MDYPSIDRLAELQQFIADFAKVKRKITLANNPDFENDVEHSYGLAMTAWYLHDKIVPELDITKILKYSLSHDLVEVFAGDTYFLDKNAVAKKESRERIAIQQLRKVWSDFPEPIDFAEDYMDKIDEEAKYVKAVDKLLPVLMIGLGEGMNVHHIRNGLTMENLREDKKSIHVSEHISPYYDLLFEWLERVESHR